MWSRRRSYEAVVAILVAVLFRFVGQSGEGNFCEFAVGFVFHQRLYESLVNQAIVLNTMTSSCASMASEFRSLKRVIIQAMDQARK